MPAQRASTESRMSPDQPVALALSACLSAQRPETPCTACAEACPERAIRIDAREVNVRAEACSGCGLCAAACPTGAIAVAGFVPTGRVDCARVHKTTANVLPCLAGITAHALRDGLVQGDITLVDRGLCAACALSGGDAAPWAAAVDAVNAEMVALDLDRRVRVVAEKTAKWRARPAPRPATDNPTRRALFNRFAQAGASDDTSGSNVPGKAATPGPRTRAAQLSRLADGRALPRALFPAFHLAKAPGDLAALARLCPTNAFDIDETGDSRALIFAPAACIDCGACEATGLMRREDAPRGVFTGPETLATEPRATCTRCRMRFTPRTGEATCAACARDTDIAALAHGLMRPRPNHDTTL